MPFPSLPSPSSPCTESTLCGGTRSRSGLTTGRRQLVPLLPWGLPTLRWTGVGVDPANPHEDRESKARERHKMQECDGSAIRGGGAEPCSAAFPNFLNSSGPMWLDAVAAGEWRRRCREHGVKFAARLPFVHRNRFETTGLGNPKTPSSDHGCATQMRKWTMDSGQRKD